VIKILHLLFWYVLAHLLVFGLFFLAMAIMRRTRGSPRLAIGA
jgi:hypothetical protein